MTKLLYFFLFLFIVTRANAQDLITEIQKVTKASENKFYAEKIEESLEKRDYYNTAAGLANIQADSSLIYGSLRVALADNFQATCETMLTIEHHTNAFNWKVPLYTLDQEKFLTFCEKCKEAMPTPFIPGGIKRRTFEINPESRSLYELSIIVKDRDQLIRKLSNRDQFNEIEKENFLLIDYILENLKKLNKEEQEKVVSNIQVAMHHQGDPDKRDEYKSIVLKCKCISTNFMDDLFQYRTDRIRHLQKTQN